jgi:hypothetical protein
MTTGSGANAGSLANGVWGVRPMNTLDVDGGGIASLAGSQLTLPAGTYYCRINCPANRVGHNQARLVNATLGGEILRGNLAFSNVTSDNATTFSEITGQFTLGASSLLQVEHITAGSTGAPYEAGAAGTWPGDQVHLVAEFWKL